MSSSTKSRGISGHPELITQGKRLELKAIKRITGIHLATKYLVVVCRDESGRKAIIRSTSLPV